MTKKEKRERLIRVRNDLSEYVGKKEIAELGCYLAYDIYYLGYPVADVKENLTQLGIYDLWLREGHTWSKETLELLRTITHHIRKES